jgi:hypothetical protein
MRFIVWDKTHNKVFGIFGLCDPLIGSVGRTVLSGPKNHRNFLILSLPRPPDAKLPNSIFKRRKPRKQKFQGIWRAGRLSGVGGGLGGKGVANYYTSFPPQQQKQKQKQTNKPKPQNR